MKGLVTGVVVFGVISAAAAGLMAFWLSGESGYDLKLRLPGGDRPAGLTGQDVPVKLEGRLETFNVPVPDLRGSWTGFRGPNRDNISPDMTGLATSWPEGGPPALWRLKVGEGHAGPAILNGRVFLHDYDMDQRADVIRCLSLADGRDIWRYTYRVMIKRTHGVSRSVPAVTDKHLVAIGPKCHVTCLDSATGQLRWAIDLVREYGTKVPPWYAAQCPLIDGEKAILAPGGSVTEAEQADGTIVPRGKDVLMMAVDCQTGKVMWQTPNANGWNMTHSSIAVMDLDDGVRTYVYCASGGVMGVDAETGKTLWQTDQWRIRIANIPTPVPVGENRLFLCGGYNAGSMMLQIVKEADRYVPRELWRLEPKDFGATQQTPVLYKNHLFGARVDEQFVCLGLNGQAVWTSGPDHKFGREGGPYLIADDLIFAMDDGGVLTLLKATPQSFQVLARAKVLPEHDSWGPMALAGGRLIARDMHNMVCLDVSKEGASPGGSAAQAAQAAPVAQSVQEAKP